MQINKYLSGPMGVNCYLVVDSDTKKAFMVDPGGENEKMTEHLKKNNIQVEYIILTHGHGDHIGGVNYYADMYPEAKIVAHEDEKELLEDPDLNHSKFICGEPVSVFADILVKDGDVLDVGSLNLKFLSTPGHTPGSMCIYVGNSLFSGDTLFSQSVGRTDFPKSSFTELKKSILDKLYTLPNNTDVYPGHMGTTTIEIEKEYNPFV